MSKADSFIEIFVLKFISPLKPLHQSVESRILIFFLLILFSFSPSVSLDTYEVGS